MTAINPQETFSIPDLDPETAALFARFAENLLQYAVTGDIDELGFSADAPAGELVLASAEEGSSTSAVGANAADEELSSDSSADTADACASPERIASTIRGRCDGAIRAIQAINSSDESATRIAIKMGFFDPSAVNESAALREDTRFVEYEDGSIKVFDLSGKEIAAMDCNGTVTNYFGDTPEERMIDTVPCVPAEVPVPEPELEAVMESEPVVESEPEPVAVEPVVESWEYENEPEPEPEPLPVTDRVRVFQSFAYACNGEGECDIFPRFFLTFNSPEDAEEFFASDAGRVVLQQLLQTGYLGNCIYITDGTDNLQQISFLTEDNRIGNRTIRQLVLKDGVPILSGEPYDSTFTDDRPIETRASRIKDSNVYTLTEAEFENRLGRGIGDASDADNREVPRVTEGNASGVGNLQELKYNDEEGRWELMHPFEANPAGVDAILDASDLTPEAYAAIRDIPLPQEFYDPDATIAEKARALREAAEARGIDLSRRGSENLARILTEQGFGQDGGIVLFPEKAVSSNTYGDSGVSMVIPETQPGGGHTTLDQAVKQSALNREVLVQSLLLQSR